MQEYSEDPADTNLRGLPLYYADFDKELSTASSNGSTITVSPVPDETTMQNFTIFTNQLL